MIERTVLEDRRGLVMEIPLAGLTVLDTSLGIVTKPSGWVCTKGGIPPSEGVVLGSGTEIDEVVQGLRVSTGVGC
jgi:hypothetical protein